MTNKTDVTNVPGTASAYELETDAPDTNDSGKKQFVEPELSGAVSVLEVTTFFQNATSGVTN